MKKLFLLAVAMFFVPAASTASTMNAPEIWSHRGASFLSFENTLEAFELGAELGATGFELDLVLTKDKQLAVYHDLTLNESTNVEDLFPTSRARMETDDAGNTIYTYYVEDFTMAELRTLTLEVSPADAGVRNELAKDPNNPFAVAPDHVFRIPSYDEALDLLASLPEGHKVLTEVKVAGEGTPADRQAIIDNLLAEWTARDYTAGQSPVVVQSFSKAFMLEIDEQLEATSLDVPTYFLDFSVPSLGNGATTQADLNAAVAAEFSNLTGLALFQGVFDITNPPFAGFVNPDGLDIVEAAMLAGLQTFVWTLSLPATVDLGTYYDWLVDPDTQIDFGMSYAEFYELGLNGIITDTPDIAVATYETYLSSIPVPMSGLLLLSGLGALAFRRKR